MILAVVHNIIELDDTVLFVATFDPIERIIIAYRSSSEIDETPHDIHLHSFAPQHMLKLLKMLEERRHRRDPTRERTRVQQRVCELCQTAAEYGIGGAKQMPHGGDSEICGSVSEGEPSLSSGPPCGGLGATPTVRRLLR
ncbi:unnamed protein product [Calypogeia fissa]